MSFPWSRYLRRVGVIFVIAFIISLIAMARFDGGHVETEVVLVAVVDSIVLAIVVAFPLTQRVYRGPRQ